MKTRNSIDSGKEHRKGEVEISPDKICNDARKASSPLYVRKLRSRVITSDNEDDVLSARRTPKSARKKTKENNESVEIGDTDDALKDVVGFVNKSPKANRRRTAMNLFRIDEIKDENIQGEDTKMLKREVSEEKPETESYSENEEISSNSNELAVQKSPPSTKIKGSEHGYSTHELLGDVSDETRKAVVTKLMKDGPGKFDENSNKISRKKSLEHLVQEELAITEPQLSEKDESTGSDENSGSDDDMPEAVSFSSGKEAINKELSMAAEAIRMEKEKRKEVLRKRIEMFKIQKAEKERKRAEKLKLLKSNIPHRLTEDVISSLPDKPDIPTIVKSVSSPMKRKAKEEMAEIEVDPPEVKKSKIVKFDDYIPLVGVNCSTNFGVVPLDVTNHIPKSSSQKAAQFKLEALYGSRIRREPSKNLLMYRKKLAASGKL